MTGSASLSACSSKFVGKGSWEKALGKRLLGKGCWEKASEGWIRLKKTGDS
jgi:hypothetical protein